MTLIKSMNKKELLNWKKTTILGFFAYMLIAAVNYIYYLAPENSIFSPTLIFWSSLVVAFAYEFILNFKDKRNPSGKV